MKINNKMNKYLLKDPNVLYNLYKSDDVIYYYNYDFLYPFKSIEIEIFYDILNSINTKQLMGLYIYIIFSWIKTEKNIKDISVNKLPFVKNITNNIFNKNVKQFINNDPSLSIYVMNTILKFLYPCNLS